MQHLPHDSQWMRLALELAAQGQGRVEPNPLVGCVLVDPATNQALGQGFHARYGGAHAERAAIADAQTAGNSGRLAGCTAYVTLEPCCHHGKTPPCIDALLEIGADRVVAAMLDPFDLVSGQGIARLAAAGVSTSVGVEGDLARELNAPYLKRLQRKRPWIIAKWAMSLDGRIATRTGDSQWISCEASRRYVQELRGRVDAIVVGSGTALADDPLLTARTSSPPPRVALRVVADSQLQISPTSQLVQTAGETPVLLWAGPQASPTKAQQLRDLGCQVHVSNIDDANERLDALLHALVAEHSATNVLVEGGGRLLGSLLELRELDQCEVFVSPKIIGGSQAISPVLGLGIATLAESPGYTSVRMESSGDDAHISCRLMWPG